MTIDEILEKAKQEQWRIETELMQKRNELNSVNMAIAILEVRCGETIQ